MARLLQTLEEVEAVERVDGPRWRIGPGVASLAGTASPERSLVAVARPHLARLVADVGEDAGLALPDGYDVHYVDQVESDNPVQVRDWTGTRAPMHAVPSGLVLLAEWPEEALDGVPGARARAAHVAHGRRRGDAAAPPRATSRDAGFAWGREEFAEGISSVAAPVRDGRGKAIAALHVHGPSYRFPARGAEQGSRALVAEAAAAAGRELSLAAS